MPRGSGTTLLVALLGLGAGCSTSPDMGPNRPPEVRILVGPVTNSVVSYRAAFSWEGSDPDGSIVRFEYALDPDPRLGMEELSDPAAHGLLVEDSPGLTRMIKPVPGEPPAVAEWRHTRERHAVLSFSADSLDSASLAPEPASSLGAHRVYLRAIDDDGASSVPARTAFATRSFCPTTRLVSPPPADMGSPLVRLPEGTALEVAGHDPDGPGVAGYLLQVVDLCRSDPGEVLEPSMVFSRDPGAWTLHETTGIVPELPPCDGPEPHRFAIAVRARDGSGAADPYLDWNRNAFVQMVDEGYVFVTLELPGVRCSPGPSPEVEIYDGRLPPFLVRWGGSRGSEPFEMRWGIDTSPDGEGWSDWIEGSTLVLPPVPVDEGLHSLVVESRNRFDARSRNPFSAWRLRSFQPPERGNSVLVVDDVRDGIFPRDHERDAFWTERLLGAGLDPGLVRHYETFGRDDIVYASPIPPTVEDLFSHRIVIWTLDGTGWSGFTGLSDLVCGTLLDSYLASGGNLWVTGVRTRRAMGYARFSEYPIAPRPQTLAWDLFRIRFSLDCDLGEDREANDLREALPWPGAADPWPALTVDDSKIRETTRDLGLTFVGAEGSVDFPGVSEELRGIVEPVYVYGANGPRRHDLPSPLEGTVCGTRWHDPDPAATEGRVAWFGFPLYYVYDDQAQAVVDRVLDWFAKEPTP